MSLTERINEAINSKPVVMSSFEDCQNIRSATAFLNGENMGQVKVGKLPYGAGHIVELKTKVVFADSHKQFIGRGTVNIERRPQFRECHFPLRIEYMD